MKSINWKATPDLLGIAAFVGLLIFVGLALQLYVVGILLTAATFVLFKIRRVGLLTAISYCCFFLVGTVVAKLQWMISTEVGQLEIYSPIAMVGAFSIIGFLSWLFLKNLFDEKLLIAIIVLTFGLPISLSGSMQFFNWYARFYALVCLAAPVVVLAQTWSKSREPHAPG